MSHERAGYVILMSEEYVSTLNVLLNRVGCELDNAGTDGRNEVRGISIHDMVPFYDNLRDLRDMALRFIENLRPQYCVEENRVSQFQGDNSSGPFFQGQSSGLPGRPRIPISQEQIETLEDLGFSYAQMANILCETEQTLRNRRREFGMNFGRNRYSDISDNDLDSVVVSVLQVTPEVGERYMMGALRSRGYHIQRSRIRKSILRVDPVGRACRRRRIIFRRQYSVPGPNSLW